MHSICKYAHTSFEIHKTEAEGAERKSTLAAVQRRSSARLSDGENSQIEN